MSVPAKQNPRVLVGRLCTGEPEIDRAQYVLSIQQGVECDCFFIQGEGRRTAHWQLYKEFMKKANDYDYFLKLDGDMTLVENDAIKRCVACMEAHCACHVCFPVLDALTNSWIYGMHFFHSSATWRLADFHSTSYDPHPTNTERFAVERDESPIVLHAHMKDLERSFKYGTHRAIKARYGKSLRARTYQWWTLARVAREFAREKRGVHAAALQGVYFAMEKKLSPDDEDDCSPVVNKELSSIGSGPLATRNMIFHLRKRTFFVKCWVIGRISTFFRRLLHMENS